MSAAAGVDAPPAAPPAAVEAPPTTVAESLPKTRGFLFRFGAWGKPYWQVAHSVTFLYPDAPTPEDRQRALVFFKMLPFILPCSLCGLHFVNTMRDKLPLTDKVLASRDSLSRWLVQLHNLVNVRVGKPEVAYEDAKRFYMVDSELAALRRHPPPAPERYKTGVIVLSVLLAATLVALVACVTRGGRGR
jgi:hypothetical protein